MPPPEKDALLEKFVGYGVVKNPARLELPARRAALLNESLLALVRSATVDTEVLATLVGIWVWGALLRRELLAIPHAVLSMLDRLPKRKTHWWSSATVSSSCNR